MKKKKRNISKQFSAKNLSQNKQSQKKRASIEGCNYLNTLY